MSGVGNSPPKNSDATHGPTNGIDSMTESMIRRPVPDSRSSGQRIAGDALPEREQQQAEPDQPVDLARPPERAGEEDASQVDGDRAEEHERRPVVDLAHEQARLDLERQPHHRVVGGRHRLRRPSPRTGRGRSSRARRACRRTSGTCRSRRGSTKRTARSRRAGRSSGPGRPCAAAPRVTAAMPVRLSSQPTTRSSSVGRSSACVRRASASGARRLALGVSHRSCPRSSARPARGSRPAPRTCRPRPAGSAAAAAVGPPGPKVGVAPVEDVERRLVARADQLVLGGAVQPDRAAGVRAQLRVRDAALRRPGHAVGRQLEQPVRDADQEGLGIRRARRPPPGTR